MSDWTDKTLERIAREWYAKGLEKMLRNALLIRHGEDIIMRVTREPGPLLAAGQAMRDAKKVGRRGLNADWDAEKAKLMEGTNGE
jgi:hypothetical protein